MFNFLAATFGRPQTRPQPAAQDGELDGAYGGGVRYRPRLTAQIDPLSGWARLHNGELLPPQIAQTLSLTQFDRGRSQRDVDLPLRQFLGAVDG